MPARTELHLERPQPPFANWCSRPIAVLQGPKAKRSLGNSRCRVSWFTYTRIKTRPWRPTL